jgi:hypothetical protein
LDNEDLRTSPIMSSGENSPRNSSSADEEIGSFESEKALKLDNDEALGTYSHK